MLVVGYDIINNNECLLGANALLCSEHCTGTNWFCPHPNPMSQDNYHSHLANGETEGEEVI